MEGGLLALDVPIRSQLDGSEYQMANCGPASLAMVLAAFGVEASIPALRNLANRRQGTYGLDSGIALGYLGDMATTAGLRPLGLGDGTAFHRWSVEEVREQVRHGHPVITLVKLRELPDHAGSRSQTDHYVVVVGLDGERLLINDPARNGELGFRRPLSPAQLERAWDRSSVPRQALAFGAPVGVAELAFPGPGAGSGPGEVVAGAGELASPPAAGVAMTLPQMPPPAPAQAGSAAAPQVVVVVTPVIHVNVNVAPAAPAPPEPVPTRDRWARIESPAMPVAEALPSANPNSAMVLGTTGPAPDEGTLRWIARFAMVSVAALVLRWSLK